MIGEVVAAVVILVAILALYLIVMGLHHVFVTLPNRWRERRRRG